VIGERNAEQSQAVQSAAGPPVSGVAVQVQGEVLGLGGVGVQPQEAEPFEEFGSTLAESGTAIGPIAMPLRSASAAWMRAFASSRASTSSSSSPSVRMTSGIVSPIPTSVARMTEKVVLMAWVAARDDTAVAAGVAAESSVLSLVAIR